MSLYGLPNRLSTEPPTREEFIADFRRAAEQIKAQGYRPHTHLISAEDARRGGGFCVGCGCWVETADGAAS